MKTKMTSFEQLIHNMHIFRTTNVKNFDTLLITSQLENEIRNHPNEILEKIRQIEHPIVYWFVCGLKNKMNNKFKAMMKCFEVGMKFEMNSSDETQYYSTNEFLKYLSVNQRTIGDANVNVTPDVFKLLKEAYKYYSKIDRLDDFYKQYCCDYVIHGNNSEQFVHSILELEKLRIENQFLTQRVIDLEEHVIHLENKPNSDNYFEFKEHFEMLADK